MQTISPTSFIFVIQVKVNGGKMKSLILLIFLLAGPAMARGVLVELKQSADFSDSPRGFDLKVLDDGEVVLITRAYKLNYVSTKSLASLSEDTMVKLQQMIDAIPADAQVIYAASTETQCAQGPSTEIMIAKSDQFLKIASEVSCQLSVIKDTTESTAIAEFMKSILAVAD
jgi:hypothetical protein